MPRCGRVLVFAELAAGAAAWTEALRGWNVQQSKQVLEWQAEARKEGELKGKAEAVLRVLQSRTGRTIPVALANVIRNTTDTDILDQWIDVATSVNSLKEFRRRINS